MRLVPGVLVDISMLLSRWVPVLTTGEASIATQKCHLIKELQNGYRLYKLDPT